MACYLLGKRKHTNPLAAKKAQKVGSEAEQAMKLFLESPDENDPDRKGYHNAIEKKRRDKMNTYIQDIRLLILENSGMQIGSKSDKLSILKGAFQYLRSMRGIPNTDSSVSYPSFLFQDELTKIISKMNCGFIMVTDAAEGTIVWNYNLDPHLGYEKGELLGTSIFSLIKECDVTIYKLNSAPNDKENLRVTNKRSFITNFLCKPLPHAGAGTNQLETRHYLPILLSGEVHDIKTVSLLGDKAAPSGLGEHIKCFVAIGQGLTTEVLETTQEMRDKVKVLSREGPEGKIEHINDSVYYIMGYAPSELIGHTFLEFVHPHDSKRLYASLFEASNSRSYTNPINIRLKQKSSLYKTVSSKKLAVRHPIQGTVTSFISCMEETRISAENWDLIFPVEEPIVDELYDPVVMMRQETFRPQMLPNQLCMEPAQIPAYPNVLLPNDFDSQLSTFFETPIYLKEAVDKYEFAQNFVDQPFKGPINNNVQTGYNSLLNDFVDVFESQPF